MPSNPRTDAPRALVTGAASGIGRATARALAGRARDLILVDVDGPGLDALAGELSCPVHPCVVDVGDRAAMEALAEQVHTDHGPLDILVNNAGVGVGGPLLETTLDDWEWMLRVNLSAVVMGCALFLPRMLLEPGRPHVVNVASAAGLTGLPTLGAYSTSKCAVVAYSQALRAEHARRALGVTVLCPGFVPTEIGRSGRYTSEEYRAETDYWLTQPRRNADVVAAAMVKAIDRNRFLVPLYAEAWLTLTVGRLPNFVRGPVLDLVFSRVRSHA